MDPQMIEAVAVATIAAILIAGAIVGLRHARANDERNFITMAVSAVEQQYGQLDGPERLAMAEELIVSRYPKIDPVYLRTAIEAAVMILGLTIDAVEAGYIEIPEIAEVTDLTID